MVLSLDQQCYLVRFGGISISIDFIQLYRIHALVVDFEKSTKLTTRVLAREHRQLINILSDERFDGSHGDLSRGGELRLLARSSPLSIRNQNVWSIAGPDVLNTLVHQRLHRSNGYVERGVGDEEITNAIRLHIGRA